MSDFFTRGFNEVKSEGRCLNHGLTRIALITRIIGLHWLLSLKIRDIRVISLIRDSDNEI